MSNRVHRLVKPEMSTNKRAASNSRALGRLSSSGERCVSSHCARHGEKGAICSTFRSSTVSRPLGRERPRWTCGFELGRGGRGRLVSGASAAMATCGGGGGSSVAAGTAAEGGDSALARSALAWRRCDHGKLGFRSSLVFGSAAGAGGSAAALDCACRFSRFARRAQRKNSAAAPPSAVSARSERVPLRIGTRTSCPTRSELARNLLPLCRPELELAEQLQAICRRFGVSGSARTRTLARSASAVPRSGSSLAAALDSALSLQQSSL